jgi:2-keto-4-pentenoate hydratase/2-oxohepta-3-ene-1,7-dioic acid hydratase in catechol pathway
MLIVRFRAGGAARYGALEGAHVVEYTGTPWSQFRRGRRRYALRQVVLVAPVTPSKIVGAGGGRDAPGEPVLYLKPTSALVGPDDPIVYPPQSGRVAYEAALAVVVRRPCRNVPAARARDYVLGYACLNDVTARDLLERDGQWTRAKGFDTFCPVGPCIATDLDPAAVTLETWVNGERRHAIPAKEFPLPVEELVARISEVMTLLPGDVVATGAPHGGGPLAPGDRVEVRIDGIGSLRNTVVKP